MTTIRLDRAALKALEAELVARLLPVGHKVAERAASAAPKRTGEGAASIHAEVVGGEIRVGWDAAHWYLFFPEVGTSRTSARPFLRPALDATYTL